MDDASVLIEKCGALGLVTLNRPQALNALNRDMALAIHAALDRWAADPAVTAVAIRGRGRAFCAGGDVRALAEGVARLGPDAAVFLADEYRLDAAIAAFPKPYLALCHGYVMGGGAGLSVHGAYRLAAPSLVFAMPETAIGFVPDVGATHFLPRCPGRAGLYLGLTGARIGAGDALALGLMTHAVAEDSFDALIEALAAGQPAAKVVADFSSQPPASPLEQNRPRIDAIFSAPSVEAILERLERDGSAFALATLHQLRAMSPSALKFSFRAIRAGAGMALQGCLAMEYRVALRAIQAPDFAEGVRAHLVDKDHAPRWRPERLAALGDAVIDAYFAPTDDLTFA
jgi:enoyl-CoA hydratase